MPTQISTPSNLLRIATLLSSTSNSKGIYFYKDSNGQIQSSEIENVLVSSSGSGYPYQYTDGTVIYTMPPITSYANIPWTYDLTGLGSLATSLVLWVDAKETKSINATTQKAFSKSTNGIYTTENTNDYTFTYSSNTLDLTGQGALETDTSMTLGSAFSLIIVCTIPTQTLTNNTIFQHSNVSIKLTQQTSPAGSSQYMIGLFLNSVFVRGITLKPSDLTYKYIIYADNGDLIVNGNTAVQATAMTYTSGTSAKCYIGQTSSGTNNSQIKLHEVLYYNADINLYSTAYTYLNSKWTLSTYTDTYNVNPLSDIPAALTNSLFYLKSSDCAGSWTSATGGQTSCAGVATKFGSVNVLTSNSDGYRTAAKCLQCMGGNFINDSVRYTPKFRSVWNDGFVCVMIVKQMVNWGFALAVGTNGSSDQIWELRLRTNLQFNQAGSSPNNQNITLSWNQSLPMSEWMIVSFAWNGGDITNTNNRWATAQYRGMTTGDTYGSYTGYSSAGGTTPNSNTIQGNNGAQDYILSGNNTYAGDGLNIASVYIASFNGAIDTTFKNNVAKVEAYMCNETFGDRTLLNSTHPYLSGSFSFL